MASTQTTARDMLKNSVTAVLEDSGFKIGSTLASEALAAAEELSRWLELPDNQEAVDTFAQQLHTSLSACLATEGGLSMKLRRENMWEKYHKYRTSALFRAKWHEFLEAATSTSPSPILYQYLTDTIFKSLIKDNYQPQAASTTVEQRSLTFEEVSGLRYAAGYVPRALRKKLRKSRHRLKGELLLCIYDLLDDGDEEHDDSCKWVDMIDRGGLTHINTMTYHAFVAMEMELRKHLCRKQVHVPNLKDVAKTIKDSDDVQFYWAIVAADWEEEEAQALLELVVDLWITIRGFSFASAWIERFKSSQKKSVQKSKGVRKKLCATTSKS